MYKELFRFKAERDIESIKKGIQEATGESDFFGFDDVEDQREFLEKSIRDGFIEFDGEYVIINADM